jgi:hypothetical protein
MPDIQELINQCATVTLQYRPDWSVTLEYRPERYEHRMTARLIQIEETKDIDAIVDVLMTLMSKWDVTDNGKPLPITPEVLADRPLAFLSALLGAIQEDIRTPKNDNDSATGSSVAAKPERAKAGTSSFARAGS